VIAHVPILCEDSGVTYIYVPSREQLGIACQTKRPTSVVLITLKDDSSLQETFNQLVQEAQALSPVY
jgi:H/ACA ribonucleoprotein complex subunit 2